jgi:hypothetical protein
MAYSYTYVSGSAIQTPPINSTKVIIVANVACYANINGTASLTSNVGTIIPPNARTPFNMQGTGNYLSLLPTSGVAAISVTQVGNVALSGTAPAVANNSFAANITAW